MCDWLETYLVHGPGPIAGQPYRLHDDLRRFVWTVYELDPVTGSRRWDEAVAAMPKGVAKSELAGALCCVEALGPVRFDGWDSSGDPVAAPIDFAVVQIYAVDEHQTANTYGAVGHMLGRDTCSDALLRDYGRVDIGRHEESSTRVILPGHRGTIEPQTSRAASAQGGRPTFVVTEELHEWQLTSLHKLYGTKLKDLLKTFGTWGLHVTNWYAEGEGSVLESVRADYLAGTPGLLWFGETCPKGILPEGSLKKVPDDVLRRALEITFGSAASFAGLDRLIGFLRRPSTKENEWRRFYLNQPLAADHSWLSLEDWQAKASPVSIADKSVVGLGFVGTDRAAALVACSTDTLTVEVLEVWEDVDVEHDAVDGAVRAAFERFRVSRMLGNPWGWQTDLDRWAGRYGPKVILRFPLREDTRMRAALDRMRSTPWRHSTAAGHADQLRAHVLACSTRTERVQTENGWEHVPVNLTPKEAHLWITAAQAAVLAHEATCQALATAPPPPPRKPAAASRRTPTPTDNGTRARPLPGGLRSRGRRL